MTNRRRKTTFALVIPRFEDIFHSYFAGEIIRGVSLSASRINADILIRIVDRENHKTWLDESILDRQAIDGIIFADIDNDIAVIKNAINKSIPCIVLNNILREPINYVAVNNKKATVDLMEYLLKLGHKKIATIAGEVNTQSGLMRLEGFKEAIAEFNLTVPGNYITYGNFLRTPAREAALKLLKLKDRPTAIFAASDVMALEVLDVARALNIKVPHELSIIGFDDNPINRSSSIGLTTVAQPLVEMGRVGAENLYEISRGKAKLPVKLTLPTQIVLRQTTAPCP